MLLVYLRGERNTCKKWGRDTLKGKQLISGILPDLLQQGVTRFKSYEDALENDIIFFLCSELSHLRTKGPGVFIP